MRSLLLIALFVLTANLSNAQVRKAIFLYHSVGLTLWDRSQVSDLTPPTTIPNEVANYNAVHGYSGADAVSMDGEYGPVGPPVPNAIQGFWWRWDEIFSGADPYGYSMEPYYSSYPIIVIKTGYPTTQYTTTSDSVEACKAHWRSILSVMREHPSNFFILWTGYPAPTDGHSERAALTNTFVHWATDVLAQGEDSFGPVPANVLIFDSFHILASEVDGYCPPEYGSGDEGPGGDHPSNEAVGLFDPIFVRQTFDAAIAYEAHLPITWAGPPTIQLNSRSHVEIKWETLSETGTYRFYVQRKGGKWQTIDSVAAAGTSSSRTQYSVIDSSVSGGAWTYRIQEVDLDGSVRYSEPASITVTALRVPEVLSYALEQNYPNPFNPSTQIRFAMPQRGRVSLIVYDVLGAEIAVLANGILEPGIHTVAWNAPGAAAGVYFARLAVNDERGNLRFSRVGKMLLVK